MKAKIFKKYAEQISNHFELGEGEIFQKSKRRDIVDARQLLYYMCSNRPMRLRYIQEYMKQNGYDIAHSSILHGIDVVKKRLVQDEDYEWLISKVKDECVIH